MTKWRFPWPETHSVYETDGPDKLTLVELPGAKYLVEPTGGTGAHTGRDRFKVVCLTCDEQLHRGTTGPSSRIEGHQRDKHPEPEEAVMMKNPKSRMPMPGEEVELLIPGDSVGVVKATRRVKCRALHVDSFYVEGPTSSTPLCLSDFGIRWRWPNGPAPASAEGRLWFDVDYVAWLDLDPSQEIPHANSISTTSDLFLPFDGRKVRITIEEIE